MTKAQAGPAPAAADSLELVRAFPLVPITNEAHQDAAIERIDALVKRQDELRPGEAAYLDVLSTLLRDYEMTLYSRPEPMGPARALAFLMENRGMTQAEVARATGLNDSTLSEILTGKRPPSRKSIEKLSAYFRVNPSLFI